MPDVSLLNVSCPLCDEDSPHPVAVQNGYSMVQCNACRFIYLSPRPTPESLIALYDSYHERNGKSAESWDVLMERNYREASQQLAGLLPAKGKLLDVGCGYGYFVRLMQAEGWEASGIEPSAGASAHAQAAGLDVQRTVLEDAEFPAGSFDAITAFYVLEHLYNPLSALRKIRSLLKPGGVLLLRVPHTTPVVRLLGLLGLRNNLYDAPFHLSDFSPKTIRRAFQKAGFTDIRVMPGEPTMPPRRAERTVSTAAGTLARLLYAAGGEALLLPGVSKTAIARKPFGDQERVDA